MEKTSFDDVYHQVAWELCVEAATKANTELIFSFFTDKDSPYKATTVSGLEAASEVLTANRNGGVRILGRWIAGGKQGTVDIVCDESLSPTVTQKYVARYLEETIRMHIAKKLFARGAPSVESLEEAS